MPSLSELNYRVDEKASFSQVCVNCVYYDALSCTLASVAINPLATCDKQVTIQRSDAVEPLYIKGSIMLDTEYDVLAEVTEADFIELSEAALNE